MKCETCANWIGYGEAKINGERAGICLAIPRIVLCASDYLCNGRWEKRLTKIKNHTIINTEGEMKCGCG